MCTENETAEMAMRQTPQVFMQNIAFNDGTVLPLTPNSIVVFTGANNSGKSQILRDAENCLNKSNESLQIVLKNSLYDFRGDICDEAFLKGHFIINQQGHFELVGSGNSFDKNAKSLFSIIFSLVFPFIDSASPFSNSSYNFSILPYS